MSELHDMKAELIALRKGLQEIMLEAVRTQAKVDALKESVKDLEKDINNVAQSRVPYVVFQPIQRVIYGIVGTVLVAFLVAVISLIIPQASNNTVNTSQQINTQVLNKNHEQSNR